MDTSLGHGKVQNSPAAAMTFTEDTSTQIICPFIFLILSEHSVWVVKVHFVKKQT